MSRRSRNMRKTCLAKRKKAVIHLTRRMDAFNANPEAFTTAGAIKMAAEAMPLLMHCFKAWRY